MRLRNVWFSAVLLVATTCTAQAPPPSDVVVHEWGTFLAMNGSDGGALDGMYHEEHALPAFVHARSRDQLRLPSVLLKGETPVIYFYTDRRQPVGVTVRFPQGVWTQWYPQAGVVGPQWAQMGSYLEPQGGRITWCADLVPAAGDGPAPALPETASDALWNFARDVDAAYVRTTDRTAGARQSEYERFLFYRGLGRATTPLRVTSREGGTLSLSAQSPHGVRHLFVLRVENGKGAYRYLPALAPGKRVTGVIPAMTGAQPLAAFTEKIAGELAARLTASGLYAKEARAMVNTWRASYFQTDGIRVLFVLPQAWTDRFIPMEVRPRPKKIVRVMVGRTELLTPEREKTFENAVRDLGAPDAARRRVAFAYLREQGRYVEPILRRTLRTTPDAEVRTLCRRLLLTDWVTELRAAVHSATDGGRLVDDPLHARAQLASVLREAGLNKEAKAEAQYVVSELEKRKPVPLDREDARHPLRAHARAMEGLGDDAAAAEAYGKFIRFGSQIQNRCAGCHDGTAAPRTVAWFRDWYAGRKFARYTASTGQRDRAIAGHEATLKKRPHDTAALMMLAYLYESKGAKGRADALWAKAGRVKESPRRVGTGR